MRMYVFSFFRGEKSNQDENDENVKEFEKKKNILEERRKKQKR